MKKIVILSGIVGSFLTQGCAQHQSEEVPQEVKIAFNAQFPSANSIEWGKESENEWEAEFKIKKIEYSANYTSEGNWLETEHDIKASEIPSSVKTSLESDFSGYKIEHAEVAEKTNGIFYEIELEKDHNEIEVTFDSSGKLIEKVSINRKNEEDED